MRVCIILLGLFLACPAYAGAPKVEMYGASWCGPCRSVRAMLDKDQIPYTYTDIDAPGGREAYQRARPARRGIPLLIIGSNKIVGANFEAIRAALGQPKVAPSATAGEYGGQTAQWWQQQFRSMRQYLAGVKQRADALEKVAADNVDKERLSKLREHQEEVEATLQQFDNDASRVALPRKFRQ